MPEEDGPPSRGRLLGLRKLATLRPHLDAETLGVGPVPPLGLALLSQRPVEQVRQPDARPLEPIPHEGNVWLERYDQTVRLTYARNPNFFLPGARPLRAPVVSSPARTVVCPSPPARNGVRGARPAGRCRLTTRMDFGRIAPGWHGRHPLCAKRGNTRR